MQKTENVGKRESFLFFVQLSDKTHNKDDACFLMRRGHWERRQATSY
jgi:hypothetical protein